MIAELISKLAGRKAEATQTATKDWQTLVAKFVDQGDKLNADTMLAELDRLGKTLEDLEAAAELLTQRRGWATQLDAGAAAENSLPKLNKQVEDAVAELKRLTEAHNAKYFPLDGKVLAAHDAIIAGTDAKRQLFATAGEETRRVATADIDAKILDLQSERAGLRKRIADRDRWVRGVVESGAQAASVDLARLEPAKVELLGWEEEDRAFEPRFEALQAARATATAVLLKPESI